MTGASLGLLESLAVGQISGTFSCIRIYTCTPLVESALGDHCTPYSVKYFNGFSLIQLDPKFRRSLRIYFYVHVCSKLNRYSSSDFTFVSLFFGSNVMYAKFRISLQEPRHPLASSMEISLISKSRSLVIPNSLCRRFMTMTRTCCWCCKTVQMLLTKYGHPGLIIHP